MFKIKITDLSQAVELAPFWPTRMISLLDPELANPPEYMLIPEMGNEHNYRRYYFHDITEHDHFGLALLGLKNGVLAEPQDIENILNFTENLQAADKLLVHCHAGISRSTAVACGILCQHGFSPQQAVTKLLEVRSQALPNRHIIQLFDDLLELQGDLIQVVSRAFF